MKFKKNRFIFPFVFLVVSIAIYQWLSLQPEKIEKNPINKELTVVEVAIAKRVTEQLSVYSHGVVAPVMQTKLISQVTGTVNKVFDGFESGELVDDDQILFTIDDSEYNVEVYAQEASLAEAQANRSNEEAQAHVKRKLWKSRGKSLSQAPPLAIRQPQLDKAIAQEKAAEASLQQAQLDLSRTVVRSPYSGIILNRTVNLGQHITQGSVAGEIISIDSAEIRLPLTSNDLQLVNLPKYGETFDQIPVLFKSTNENNSHIWKGNIVRSEATVDSATRLHYLIARIKDPYGIAQTQRSPLKIGTFVTAQITGKLLKGVFKVPRKLLRRNEEILVLDELNNHIVYKPVSIVHRDDDFVYIDKGLNDGEKIIISNLADPIEGTEVNPISSVLTDSKI